MNAESMMAPDTLRPFLLKSASTMEVSMVTDLLSSSPLNVNFNMAPLLQYVLAMDARGVYR